MRREEAERRARLEFGSAEGYKEACRESRGLRWPDELRRNAVYALRLLRRSPGFTLTVVLTLALCIGANTALFSVVDAVLLRPLPYPRPERLAMLATSIERQGARSEQLAHTGATWEVVRDANLGMDAAVYSGWSMGVNVVAAGEARHVRQQRVGAGFFRVLGVEPLVGRGFDEDEDRERGPAVVVLGHDLWRHSFRGDPQIVGQTITLRGEPHTILGVMPPGFRTGTPAELWTPLRASTTGEGEGTNYGIVARLKDGVAWERARSELRVAGRAAIDHMQVPAEVFARLDLVPLQRGLTEHLRQRLLLLWAAVGVVMLIGCVNVAALLLARAGHRSADIATRMALGGGRAAIVRQLLTESLVLALGGGLVGVVMGYGAIQAVGSFAENDLGIWQDVRLDGRVLALSAVLTVLTSVLFGLFPALRATRMDLGSAVVHAGARGVAGPRSQLPRRVLVVAEVALGVVLLIGAGLLVRTMAHLNGLQPGFDATHVIAAEVSLDEERYASPQRLTRLFDDSLERIAGLPGVRQAAVGLSLPYERWLNIGLSRLDHPEDARQPRLTNLSYVTPGYFDVLRIPLLRGRVFDEADREGAPAVVIVNEAFVREYYGGEEPLGARIALSSADREIVGVVGDVQQRPGWGDFGPLGTMPVAYIPATQTSSEFLGLVHTWFAPSWIVRTAGPQTGLVRGMEDALARADPLLPFAGFKPLDDLRGEALARERFQALLLSLLAGLALMLAAVGIGGLIAHSVTERTRDLGIRMALGATHARAIAGIVRPGILLTVTGVAIGIVLSRLASRALGAFVYGVSPTDLPTFAAVAATLMIVAFAASLLPALRITRLDPSQTLRDE
jgi:predicted permease